MCTSGGAFQAVDGAVQRLDAPARHLAMNTLKPASSELDDVDAVGSSALLPG